MNTQKEAIKLRRHTPNTRWIVETIDKSGLKFVKVGEVFVSGRLVDREMVRHRSIKGHEAYNIAKRIAEKKFPKINPIVITPKE